MAWSGAGSFTRVGGSTHWVDDKNAAINIVASRHDTNDEDLATGINACLTRNNESKPTADFLPSADNTLSLGSASFRWKLNGDSPALLGASNIFIQSNAGTAAQIFQNTNTGVSARNDLQIQNSAHTLFLSITSTGYGTTFWTGGPTGEQIAIGSSSALPISFGTNGIERMRISAAGAITVGSNAISFPSLTTTATNAATIAVGQTLIIRKGSTTSRPSNATPSADPDLQFTNVPAGTYVIGFMLDTSSGAGGFAYRLNSTGASSAGAGIGADTPSGTLTLRALTVNIATGIAGVTTIVQFPQCYLVTSGAGTVSIDWAQNSSNAAATSVVATNFDTYLMMMRVA